jgi:hypothetical protein
MNGLMWFIYLANVIPSLASVGFFLILIGVILVLLLPPKGVELFSQEHYGPLMGIGRRSPWVAMVVGTLLITLTPSQETIYLMAGAKGAEIAVTSEAGQEILTDIQEVIEYQLESLKGE